MIENSPSKPIEAWANINAIDDVIKTLVTMNNKVSVAVLRGNAGAGGAMLAAACDFSVAHMVCFSLQYVLSLIRPHSNTCSTRKALG